MAQEPEARKPAAPKGGGRDPAVREPEARKPGARKPRPGKSGVREPGARTPAVREPTVGEPAADDVPRRLVVVAFVLAAVCALLPLAVLGAGFAGAVMYQRGRRGAGAGVIAVAVLCTVLGVLLRIGGT